MSNKSLLFQGSPYDITSPTDSVIGADFQVFVQVFNQRSLRAILKSSRCRVWARRSKSGRGRSGKPSWGKPRRRFWPWGRCSLPRSATQQATFNWKFLRNSTENSGLKRRLGITQWREFSEDMTQVVNILTLCFLRSFSRVWRTYKRVLATREQLRIFNLQRYLPSYSLPLLSAVNKFNYIYWRHSNHCRPMLWHSNNYRPLLGHWFHCRNLSWHSNHWKQL